jgi:hypothetical protein
MIAITVFTFEIVLMILFKLFYVILKVVLPVFLNRWHFRVYWLLLVVVIIGIIPGQNTPGEYRLKTQ